MRRALIEEQLPLPEVNRESSREKSLRHGNISTLHLWWARRPLSMSRAVVFATLMPDPGDEGRRNELMGLIAAAAPFEAGRIGGARLRSELENVWTTRKPKILDCFAGGGAIPLEGVRLGCEVHAVDVNPVAHLIQLCTLDFPMRFSGRTALGSSVLAEDIDRWGAWIRSRAEPRLAEYYPKTSTARPAVYFWCRTMRCPDANCGRAVPLLKSRKLAVSKQRAVWIDVGVSGSDISIHVRQGAKVPGEGVHVGTIKASSMTCPACGTTASARDVRAYAQSTGFGERLYAVMETRGRERTYRDPSEGEDDAVARAADAVNCLPDYQDGTSAVPDEVMVKSQYRRFANLVYGLDRWRDLFNPRQLLLMATLAQLVREAYDEMIAEGESEERAKALATYLACAVDRAADYCSSFTSWAVTGEFVAHTFPQQSIRMAWDYPEVDVFADVSGSWDGAIEWIRRVVENVSDPNLEPAIVRRGNAQALEYADGEFDAVIIDPPYYDAFQYGDLSDFFYIWMKRSIGNLYPELFVTPLTPKSAEVIENRADKKSPEFISHAEFEQRLQRSLQEVARVVKPEGLVSIVFAHTDVEAWEMLLRALREAGLVVTTSWPMRSERTSRPTAMVSAVLSSSVVLVCRKDGGTGEGFYDDVVRELEDRVVERLGTFEEMHLVGADYFVSAIGPAFEVFARYSRVVRLSGEEVDVDELMVLARQSVARHAIRRLLGGENLSSLDGRSLFYLTWRWAYDGEPIPADEAYKLGRAFDIDLNDLARPNDLIAKSGDGFKLLGPHERKDPKLTATPSLVDVLHLAARLHDSGRRNELAELLGATGMGGEPGFWATASAVAESLPDGNRERTMLLGLSGNKDQLARASANHVGTSFEELTLFGNN